MRIHTMTEPASTAAGGYALGKLFGPAAFAVLVVIATGWHGGKLVFDYRLGTSKGN